MKILIIEDEKILAEALSSKLQRAGDYSIKVVEEGSTAYAEATKFKPDIVLLDLILPGKDGFDVLKELKADEELKNIPVLVLSNLDADEDIKKALSLGAVDYFVKSNHPLKEVVDQVKKYLLTSK